ncbi:glucose-6-phosphate 1-epimerase [Powellomyces hirtus]|uniref:Glucose-6-phosphate 1-epimerase n=1 Tax=Powellomyces hirtus TaxID=109895 RepID=A0A507DX03_9FUNG|nr:glucose-6-phosphate 1-epimerase [Powellomyces hirtus]
MTGKGDTVTLTIGTSTAEIYLFGATLTSWKTDGVERIFVSETAHLDGSKAIRGGIPLVFPHFGTVATSKLPQHGFARNSSWECVKKTESTAEFHLKPDGVPTKLRELWPHDFHLIYTVTLAANTLKTSLTINNPSQEAWDFTTLLHTYFAVKDISRVKVAGLKGYAFLDKVNPPEGDAKPEESREHVNVAGEVDRVYEAVSNNKITILETGSGDVEVHKSHFPDVVVWNPWIEKAKAMADFGDEDYRKMICVEVGSVTDFISLAPGKTWEGSQTLVVARL